MQGNMKRKTAKDIEAAMETVISAQNMINTSNRPFSGANSNSFGQENTPQGIDEIQEKKY